MARKNRDTDWITDEIVEEKPAEPCWLCGRPLGKTVDRFHPIPKSRGGRDTVPVHPICRKPSTPISRPANSSATRKWASR